MNFRSLKKNGWNNYRRGAGGRAGHRLSDLGLESNGVWGKGFPAFREDHHHDFPVLHPAFHDHDHLWYQFRVNPGHYFLTFGFPKMKSVLCGPRAVTLCRQLTRQVPTYSGGTKTHHFFVQREDHVIVPRKFGASRPREPMGPARPGRDRIKLRDYQEDAFPALVRALRGRTGSASLIAGCGFGKTVFVLF